MKTIVIDGKANSITGWARQLHISKQAFHRRLARRVDGEHILRPRNERRTYKCKTRDRFGLSSYELAELSGVSPSTVLQIIKRLDTRPGLKVLYRILVMRDDHG